MIRALQLALGTTLFGAAVFYAGWHVYFPGEAAVARARYAVQEAGKGKWVFQAADASPWRLSGVSFEDAVLARVDQPRRRRIRHRRGDDPAEEPAAKATPVLRADTLDVGVDLLALARGKKRIRYAMDALGGEASGILGLDEDRRRIVLDAEDIDVSQLPLKGESWSVAARGRLRLDADLDMPRKATDKSRGEVHLSIDDLVIDSATVHGFDIGSATFTEAGLDLVVKKGKLSVDEGRFASDLFTVDLDGDVTLSDREPSRWRLRLEAKVELDEGLDKMLSMLPRVKDARDDDGVYHFLCSGSLGRPYCRPDRIAAGHRPTRSRAVRTPREPRGPGPDLAPRDEGDKPAADDDRRKRRLERIRQRRERARASRLEEGPPEDLGDRRGDDMLPPRRFPPEGGFEGDILDDELPPDGQMDFGPEGEPLHEGPPPDGPMDFGPEGDFPPEGDYPPEDEFPE